MTRQKKFKDKCNSFCTANYSLIPKDKVVKADFSLSNHSCHFNAVAAVNAGRADEVWLVWAGGSNGVVHFINSKGGKFFDETWHEWDSPHEYRIIRRIHRNEYSAVGDILNHTKKMLYMCCGNLIDKWHASRNLSCFI